MVVFMMIVDADVDATTEILPYESQTLNQGN